MLISNHPPCTACLWPAAAASPATTAAERSLSPCPCVCPRRRTAPAEGPPPLPVVAPEGPASWLPPWPALWVTPFSTGPAPSESLS